MAPDADPPRPKRRRRRWFLRIAIGLLVLLIAAELYARFGLGLGDPPLMMRDPEIEYLYRPSRTYQRLGNRISINSFSMRSDEFPRTKTDPNEFRVLLLGDSVINGGSRVDQNDIVSEVLRRQLTTRFNRPVVVANASAPSWGPPNLLAYVKRFGLFDADLVIIVVGSEDYGDVPTFGPLSVDNPEHAPLCALQEVVRRYGPKYFGYVARGMKYEPPPPPATAAEIEQSLQAFRDLIDLIQQHHIDVAVGMHLEFSEITGQAKPGYLALELAAKKRNVPVIEISAPFSHEMLKGHQPFRDFVHPNALGHSLMADAIFYWIVHNDAAAATTRPGHQ